MDTGQLVERHDIQECTYTRSIAALDLSREFASSRMVIQRSSIYNRVHSPTERQNAISSNYLHPENLGLGKKPFGGFRLWDWCSRQV